MSLQGTFKCSGLREVCWSKESGDLSERESSLRRQRLIGQRAYACRGYKGSRVGTHDEYLGLNLHLLMEQQSAEASATTVRWW